MLQNGRLWRHAGADAIIWALMITASLIVRRPWSFVLVGPLFAAFSFRAFALMHEAVHAAAARDTRLNAWTGFICGVFCFLPFAGWRAMHIEHHHWTGNIDRDPTTKILLAFEARGFKMPAHWNFAWRFSLPFLGLMQHVVFWKATVTRREFRFLAASLAYLSLSAWLLGPVSLATGIFVYLGLVEMVNLPHHLGMAQYHGERRFAVHEQNQFTRSCVYPRWFAHHVLLNFNLHTAHHMFPSHPWYQLDELHEEVERSGLQLNQCRSRAWTAEQRRRNLDDVLAMSFAGNEAPAVKRAA